VSESKPCWSKRITEAIGKEKQRREQAAAASGVREVAQEHHDAFALAGIAGQLADLIAFTNPMKNPEPASISETSRFIMMHLVGLAAPHPSTIAGPRARRSVCNQSALGIVSHNPN
jgi:hypothetical protein